MSEVSWNQFVKRWREVYGKGLTYGQAMVACSSVWSDPDQKQEFISKHILNESSLSEPVLSTAPPKPEDTQQPQSSESIKAEHPRVSDIKASAASPRNATKSLEYYQAKARYYKLKATTK